MLVMRLLMGKFMGMTRRVMGMFVVSMLVFVVVKMRDVMLVLVLVHGRALLKGMEMLKTCQLR
jgi:hypothetical protein